MCQTLVNKVARSRQLVAIAEPELLVLFEEWLEELEEETRRWAEQGQDSVPALAERLGVSLTGAQFLLGKLKRERRR